MSDRPRRVMTAIEKAIVSELEIFILSALQDEEQSYQENTGAAKTRSWEARHLMKKLVRCYRFWDRFHTISSARPRLIKLALSRLKAAGKLITTPIRSKYGKWRPGGERHYPIRRWDYRLASSPLEALAALNPLDT